MIKDFKKIEISDYEIKQNKPVYSIDSILYFKQKYNPKNIYLAIGEDNLNNFIKWHRFKEINKEVKLIIASRKKTKNQNNNKEFIEKFKQNAIKLNINVNCSSSQIRQYLYGNFIDKRIESYLLDSTLNYIKEEIKK